MNVLIGVGQIVLGIVLGYFITRHFFNMQLKVDNKNSLRYYNNDLINEVVELSELLWKGANDFARYEEALERQRQFKKFLNIKGHLLSIDMDTLVHAYHDDVVRLLNSMIPYAKNSTNQIFMATVEGQESVQNYNDSIDEITGGILEDYRLKIVEQTQKEFK